MKNELKYLIKIGADGSFDGTSPCWKAGHNNRDITITLYDIRI